MESIDAYETMMAELADGARILIDGGTGTEIERRGIAPVDNGWSSSGALDGPEIVREVHEDFARAGARIIISNTFSTSRHALADAGIEDHFEQLNREGVELAIQARDNTAARAAQPVLVAGGITDWSWTENKPTLPDLAAGVEQQVHIMAEAGADLLMLEMMCRTSELRTVLGAAATTGLPVWVGISCRMTPRHGDNPSGEAVQMLGGETLTEGIEALDGFDVPVVSIMHTEVTDVDPCLDVLDEVWTGPVGAYAHSGRFVNPNWEFNGVISPAEYATASRRWLDRGVQVIGGCCGIGPEHLDLLRPMVGDQRLD